MESEREREKLTETARARSKRHTHKQKENRERVREIDKYWTRESERGKYVSERKHMNYDLSEGTFTMKNVNRTALECQ